MLFDESALQRDSFAKKVAVNNGATIISTSIGPNPVPTGAPTPYPAFVSSFTLPPEGSFSYTFATGSTGSISVVETCSG
jgi:hypothetical protein